MKNDRLNIWWKIAVIAFALSLISILFLMILGCLKSDMIFTSGPKISLPLIYTLAYISILPLAYTGIFVFWHWKTRYVGKHPLAWAILFVIALWELPFIEVRATFIFIIIYFIMHVLPDIRKKGLYANPPSIGNPPTSLPLPKYFHLIKSSCFTLGISLILIGLGATIIAAIADFVIWNLLAARIGEMDGENITKQMCNAFLVAIDMSKGCVLMSMYFAMTSAVGALLLYISQRMKWRLMEEDEKAELREKLKSEI